MLSILVAHSIFTLSPISKLPVEMLEVGRWGKGVESGKFQWPGAGFEIEFEGTGVRAEIEDSAPGTDHSYKGKNSNTLAVRVDGGEYRIVSLVPGRKLYTLATHLGPGKHELEVYKRTESSVGWVRLHGLTVEGEKSRFVSSTKAKPLIEIYGDSNSCGYGLEESSRDTHYSPSTQNAVGAFPFRAAQLAGYQPSLICASGWGILRGYGGQLEANIPGVFDRNLIELDSSINSSHAKVLVVILGDNDFAKGDPLVAFDDAYREFVKKLRKRSPQGKIVLCVSSPMFDALGRNARSRVSGLIDSILQENQDSKLFKFEFPRYDADWGYGADWHVSQKATEVLTAALAKYLEKL